MDFLWLSVGECMCAHTFVTVEMFSGELTFLSLLEYVCVHARCFCPKTNHRPDWRSFVFPFFVGRLA